MAERARRLVRIAQQKAPAVAKCEVRRRTTAATTGLLTIAAVTVLLLWVPVNVLASPASHWSPWPTWSAGVLHDFGVKARDFEVYDHRYELH